MGNEDKLLELAAETEADLSLDIEDPLGEMFAGEPVVVAPGHAPVEKEATIDLKAEAEQAAMTAGKPERTRKPRQSRALSAAAEIASPQLQEQVVGLKAESYSLPVGHKPKKDELVPSPERVESMKLETEKRVNPIPKASKEVERSVHRAEKIQRFMSILDPYDMEDRAEIDLIYETVFKQGYVKPEVKRTIRRAKK